MNPRNTGILFLVAAALVAFIYFYEIRGEAGRKQAEAQTKRLFPGLADEDVESIELTTSDGKAARLERRAGVWHMTAPLDAPADEFAAGGMASALVGAASESVFEDPQPAAVYGLDDPAHELAFSAKGERHQLRLGKKSPIGSKTYAAVGGDVRVFTLATFAVNALEKSLDDLREKRVARFEREAVRRIAASWPGGRVVLVKGAPALDAGEAAGGESDWRLLEPLDAAADSRTVDDLLSDLSFLRASGFEDAPPPAAQSGLAPPDFELELEIAPAQGVEGAEPRRLALAIGQAREGGERFVRGAEPSLYRIPAERISDFPRRVVEYRFRELAKFDSFDAQRLEITFEDRESLRIEAKSGEAGWSSEPERLDPAKLATLVRELSNLRARDILAESAGPAELAALGLEPPRVAFRAFGMPPGSKPDAAPAELLLGEVQIGISRGADGIAARRPGVETLFLLDPALAEQIPVSLEALRSRFLAPEKAEPQGTGEAEPPAAPPEPDEELPEDSP
jgi:hypothetical protein